jgi:hypothetical protein
MHCDGGEFARNAIVPKETNKEVRMWSRRFLCLLVTTILICGMAGASPPASEKGESPFEYVPDIESVGQEEPFQTSELKAKGVFTTDLGKGKPYPGLNAHELEKLNAQSSDITPENRTVNTPEKRTFTPADAPSLDPSNQSQED